MEVSPGDTVIASVNGATVCAQVLKTANGRARVASEDGATSWIALCSIQSKTAGSDVHRLVQCTCGDRYAMPGACVCVLVLTLARRGLLPSYYQAEVTATTHTIRAGIHACAP